MGTEYQVVCEKHKKFMKEFDSLKETYYRCENFPLCKITAKKELISRAIEDQIVTERVSADTIKLYRWDPSKKYVIISIVKKEKGLLKAIDNGIWR